jgi:hypothetical protein
MKVFAGYKWNYLLHEIKAEMRFPARKGGHMVAIKIPSPPPPPKAKWWNPLVIFSKFSP